jgi:signal transduction histidine kinase
LTISKKYVEALGGEIKLSSKVDKGTEVSFTIPLKISERSSIVKVMEDE